MHDWIDLALGVGVSAGGWLVVNFVGRVRDLETSQAKHSVEIRDTRSAVARMEGYLRLEPFHYADD